MYNPIQLITITDYDYPRPDLNTDLCRILMAISYVNVQDGGVDNCRTLTLYSVIIDPSCNITYFALSFVKLE